MFLKEEKARKTNGNFFCWNSTIGKTIVTIKAKNGSYCIQKRIEKLPLPCICDQIDKLTCMKLMFNTHRFTLDSAHEANCLFS